ncbi:NUDIX domain-containing protein [Candidatus Bathyarchaeota archaeon]|nr:NUDIX domain-containing protein [Candidatus Bathyarchaeota archaeon]
MPEYPPRYAVTADAIITRINGSQKEIVLIKRANPPFKGEYALPGGFVDPDETVEQACIREALEETSLEVEIGSLVGIYSAPGRDPRGRTITAAFLCMVKDGELQPSDDAAEANWIKASQLGAMRLAFDHAMIVKDAKLT